jgi:transposase-like protein
VDTGLFGFEESTIGKTRTAYPLEFRRQMVELVSAGRSPEELAREFERRHSDQELVGTV